MAVSSLMGVSTQALFAAYRQVHTIGNNIANANTEGYSRQSVVQTPSLSLRTGSGFVGTGVTVVTVQRASNQFLQDKANALTATAAADQSLDGLLGELEQVFANGEAGLGNAATQVFGAYADLSVNPSDLSARQAVLGRLDEFASLARANGSQLQMLQDNVRSDVSGAVNEVNEVAKQLASLNRQIQNSQAVGEEPNDLMDKRDALINRLAEQVDLQAYTYADGGMAVFVAGGQPLVLGTDANQLVMQRDALDPTRVGVSISIQGELTLLADNHITGGRIGGLLAFQNDALIDSRNRLGQVVTAVATALNEQQGFGIDLYGNAGAPLFQLPTPQALPAQSNARDGSGNPVSSMTLEVADAALLKASDYELLADPANAGQYVVTRLSDGEVFSGVTSGSVVDGLRITNGSTAPTAGERFLLRAVSQVPAGLQMALRDPKGLAAAGPMVASLDPDNQGSFRISGLDVVDAPSSAYAAQTLKFTSITNDEVAFDVLDSNGTKVGDGTSALGSPLLWNGLSISWTGVPVADDTLDLALTLHPGSNNGNALTLASLGDRLLVDGQLATDAYANLFADVGVRAQGAAIAADNSGAAATRAGEALAGEIGVNTDEEAARLIQYQQSYQAAAKVLQAAQTMMDTVLGLAN